MAQYGDLTTAEQSQYLDGLDASVGTLTSAVWLSNQGDIDTYVLYIFTDQMFFNERGEGFIGIGGATVLLDNIDGTFYSGGNTLVKKNDRIKIWAGYDGLNIPIFSGVVIDVNPHFGSNRVTLNCADYMYLFLMAEVNGFIPVDDSSIAETAKQMLEAFCDSMVVPHNIGSTAELTALYSQPYFERKTMLSALEDVGNSIYHTPIFDENGILQIYEREYINSLDFQFDQDQVLNLQELAETRVVNQYTIEYEDWFYAQAKDQASIDTYGEQASTRRNVLFNDEAVSEKLYGRTQELITYGKESFVITTSDSATLIDTIHIRMAQSGASGYMTANVYSDVGGVPGTLLGTSQLKATATMDTDFVWEIFYFDTAIAVDAATNYWVVLDMGSVTGEVYLLISAAEAFGKYAFENGGVWTTEDDKQPLHKVRSSKEAQTVAADIVRFMKDPDARIMLETLVGTPHIQLFDEMPIDVELDNVRVTGRYVVERKKQTITVNSYETTFLMRKTG